MKKNILIIILIQLFLFSVACESKVEKQERLLREKQQRIQLEKERKQKELEEALLLEEKRKARIIRNKYISNSLYTGATPYADCFGKNRKCSDYGCSKIKVKTPHNSDVIVTIKKNNKVYRHAYIKASDSYIFEIPNGTYQTFFYYGKGWYPDKVITQTKCKALKGGFIENEDFGKDYPITLNNQILTYELILQRNGNFSTKPSNANEAF